MYIYIYIYIYILTYTVIYGSRIQYRPNAILAMHDVGPWRWTWRQRLAVDPAPEEAAAWRQPGAGAKDFLKFEEVELKVWGRA